ncbi:hypothetical protein D3C73_1600420 [compost metagenome]
MALKQLKKDIFIKEHVIGISDSRSELLMEREHGQHRMLSGFSDRQEIALIHGITSKIRVVLKLTVSLPHLEKIVQVCINI